MSCNPFSWIFYKCYSVDGALKFVLIALLIAVYAVALIHFKKHRRGWYKFFGATDPFIDKYMGVRRRRKRNSRIKTTETVKTWFYIQFSAAHGEEISRVL